ncbi:MAG: transcription elongation factor GreA [Candidatus Harrisonbacteria bacterium]|nr:transcription elongation factor GreA [Candidatus Harrisonbacteria bacterium]
MEHLVTKAKLEELKNELSELKTTKRREVAERLKRAKELGDLSENSEYFEARDEQQQLEARIYQLDDIVKNAKLIKMTKGTDTVSVGVTIQVKKNSKEDLTLTIVGPNEANPSKGYISHESPIGHALIGKKAGDTVKVDTPAGSISYKITTID